MSGLYNRILEQTNILGITGKELGEKLGLKKSPLTDWKNNKSNPTSEQIIKLCEIFAVSADYLLLGKNKESMILSENESELLKLFQELPEREQIKFIGKLEDTVEKFKNTIN